MRLKTDEISKIIKDQIKNYSNRTEEKETGYVIKVGDGIATVHGIENAMANELIEFDGGEYSMALNLEENYVSAIILGDDGNINEGDTVKRTGRVVEVPVGDKLIGRVISTPEVKTPYDLNTPMRQYKTICGRALFEFVALVFEFIYNYEMFSNAPNKETRVKNAYFSWKTIKTMSLRSISFASEGLLSFKMANVLLAVANDDLIKAVKLLFESEKTLSLPQ
jgi:hypothetical protein